MVSNMKKIDILNESPFGENHKFEYINNLLFTNLNILYTSAIYLGKLVSDFLQFWKTWKNLRVKGNTTKNKIILSLQCNK